MRIITLICGKMRIPFIVGALFLLLGAGGIEIGGSFSPSPPYFGLREASAETPSIILTGRLTQGGFVIGKLDPGYRVSLDGTPLKVSPKGSFLIGFHRDAPGQSILEVTGPNGELHQYPLHITRREYNIQHIEGLPPAMVTPDAEQLKRIEEDQKKVAAARAGESETYFFEEGFLWPVDGIISGVYGSQRILNGEPRQPHYGIDIAAAEGTPVRAVAGGEVKLAEDLYFTGLTLIIDHGFGLTSTYSHLSRMDIKTGDWAAPGQVVGAVGSTGRSTGAHLDLRFNLHAARLDPELVLPPRSEDTTPGASGPAVVVIPLVK